jgi:FMN-dependent NADH-azoreductase
MAIERLVARHPGAEVINRDLSKAAEGHADAAYSNALAGRESVNGIATGRSSLDRSEELIVELEGSDGVVIATPMHNYTVPSALKAWIDHVVRVHRTFAVSADGKAGLLKDRPNLICVAAGGFYQGAYARQPDFLTPYLVAVLGTIGLHALTFFPLQGLVRGNAAVAAEMQGAAALFDQHPLLSPLQLQSAQPV